MMPVMIPIIRITYSNSFSLESKDGLRAITLENTPQNNTAKTAIREMVSNIQVFLFFQILTIKFSGRALYLYNRISYTQSGEVVIHIKLRINSSGIQLVNAAHLYNIALTGNFFKSIKILSLFLPKWFDK